MEFPSWSRVPIQSITLKDFSFNKFFTAFHELIQNIRQIRLIPGQNKSPSHIEVVEDLIETNVLRYARKTRYLGQGGKRTGRRGYNPVPSHGFEPRRSLKDTSNSKECWKICAADWNPKHRCPTGVTGETEAYTRRGLQIS